MERVLHVNLLPHLAKVILQDGEPMQLLRKRKGFQALVYLLEIGRRYHSRTVPRLRVVRPAVVTPHRYNRARCILYDIMNVDIWAQVEYS